MCDITIDVSMISLPFPSKLMAINKHKQNVSIHVLITLIY